jgi:hypothetical protein
VTKTFDDQQRFTGRTVSFDQQRYVRKIVSKFSKENSEVGETKKPKYKHPYLTIDEKEFLKKKEEPTLETLKQIQKYRGELNYLSHGRTDVELAMRRTCGLEGELQLRALKRIFRYLRDFPALGHKFESTQARASRSTNSHNCTLLTARVMQVGAMDQGEDLLGG